jgi:hypothetical protein
VLGGCFFWNKCSLHAHCAISSHPEASSDFQYPQFDIEVASFFAGPANTRESSATRIASFPESISVLAGEGRIQREFQLPAARRVSECRVVYGAGRRETEAGNLPEHHNHHRPHRGSGDRTPGAPSVRLPAILLCKNGDLGRTEMMGNKRGGKAEKNCKPAALPTQLRRLLV